MLRVALITYLMVGTLAGPAWCCCTFDQLARWCAPVTESKSQSSAPSGCCHRHSAPQEKKESTQPHERNSPAPKDAPCPCKDQNSGQAAPAILTSQEANDARWNGSESDQSAAFAIPVLWIRSVSDRSVAFPPSPSAFPGLTGRDILCAFQDYRC